MKINKLLRKMSFASGLILLFAPVFSSSILKLTSTIQFVLETFSPDMTLYYVLFLVIVIIVSILSAAFFIKIFKAYRLHEPGAYYLIYFLGILTTLGVLGNWLIGGSAQLNIQIYKNMQLLRTIFLFILLFALFSFHYQKENFLIKTNSSDVRKNILTFLVLAAVVGIISYPIGIKLIWNTNFFPFLPAFFSLFLVFWWKKKVSTKVLRSFIFLPGLFVIVTNLVMQLGAFYAFFSIISH